MVRVVIAQRDPGVANWLDAAGYERGTLAVRYLDAATVPAVAYRTVPLDRLDTELPLSTRRVNPADRTDVIRAATVGSRPPVPPMSGTPARFVVGTGRCGSTLLSKMLGAHRSVLNLSEVFTGARRGPSLRRSTPGRTSWTS